MKKDINSKSKNAFIWDLSGAFVRQFTSFFTSILLARLLGPEEFGLVALSMIIVNISGVLTDIGFNNALIQQKTVNQITYSSVFYINIGLGLSLTIIIALLSPWVANFFEREELIDICLALSLVPFLTSLGSIPKTFFIKELDFKSLTLRDVFATTIAGIVAVIAAFSGLGVYSLVLQNLILATLGTIIVWIAIKWRPKWEFSFYEIKKLFGFSSFIFLDNILRRVFLNLDYAFIGKVFSPVTLGFYNRAQSLKSQVDGYSTQSLSRVIFPTLSSLQEDILNFSKMYNKTYKLVSGLLVYLIAPLFFLADFFIITLLGEEWRFSISLFKILVLASLVAPHIGIMSKALLAKGYSKYRFKVGLLQRLLMLSPLVVGYYFGIISFAIMQVIVAYLIFIIFLYVMKIKFGISIKNQLTNIIVPNIVFAFFLLMDYLKSDSINQWLMVFSFLVIQSVYVIIIKHDSYLFVKFNLINVLKKKKSS